MMLALNTLISTGLSAEWQQNLRKQQLYDYFKSIDSLEENNNSSASASLASTQI